MIEQRTIDYSFEKFTEDGKQANGTIILSSCVPELHFLFSKFPAIYLLLETVQILFSKGQLKTRYKF